MSVRVIAATNKNLEEAVRQHTFREDLYYRLNVFSLSLPPLRSRMSDIELLAEHFLLKFAGSLGKDVRGFTPARWRCSGATSGPATSVSLKT